MAQQLRALAVLPEDPGSVPSTHIQWFTTTDNSSSKGSDALSGLHGHLHICADILTYTHKQKEKPSLGSPQTFDISITGQGLLMGAH